MASIGSELLVHASSPSNVHRAGGIRLKEATPTSRGTLPLVSVITAVFNGEQYLKECLDSVANQDYPNVEHIVIDGGSTDGTLNLLEKYNDQIAFWKSECDNGIYDAWNKGLTESRGEWICFLGADDKFLPGAINSYMSLAKLNPDAEFLSSRIQIEYPFGYVKVAGVPWRWRKFARFMCAVHVGSMHRRSMFERNGIFDTSYKSAADYEFLLRARSTLKAAFMPDVTAAMRAGGASASRQALQEKARAKVVTGGRNKALTLLELVLDYAQFAARPFLYSARGIVVRHGRAGSR
jgi:GT2 family glycosyltransferase